MSVLDLCVASIEFVSRGRGHEDATAQVMAWRSKCGRYLVTRRRSKYERDHRGRPLVRYCAMVAATQTLDWVHVDLQRRSYRTRQAAEQACRRDARQCVAIH